MMNPMYSSIILLVTFIMFDHCSVLAMKPGRKNATPSIPQHQQQEQKNQQQEQPMGVPPVTDVLKYLADNKKKSGAPSASSKNANPGFKPEKHNREQGDQNCNNPGQRASRINPHWNCKIDLEPEIEYSRHAPKGALKKIPAEFLPRKQGKSKVVEKPSDSAGKVEKPSGSAAKPKSKKKKGKGKFTELPTGDEELSKSMVSKIKLESEDENVKVGGKEEIAQVQEKPLEAAAGDEMVKNDKEE